MTDGFDYLLALALPSHRNPSRQRRRVLQPIPAALFSDKVAQPVPLPQPPLPKNDNRFVEENNHSLLRAYLGYCRFDTLE